MYSEESSALQIWSCLAALRILLNLLNFRLTLLSCLSVLRVYSTSYLLFLPLPLDVAFVAVANLVVILVLLAGVAPSILATSSRLLLDPPLASLDLPGLLGCLFPVISLLNGVVGALKSVAQPVCDALTPVICSYRTQYMCQGCGLAGE